MKSYNTTYLLGIVTRGEVQWNMKNACFFEITKNLVAIFKKIYGISIFRTVHTIHEFVEIRATGSAVFRLVYANHWKNVIFEKSKKS